MKITGTRLGLRETLFALLVGPAGFAGAETAEAVADRLRHDPLMMPYYTGTISPTPQKVDYRDAFIPMTDVAIVVGQNVENPGPLVDVLIDRVARYGGNAAIASPGPAHTAVVSLGDTELAGQVKDLPAVPDREQGYVLHAATAAGRPLIVLRGHDRLGLVWAIASLAQLIHWRDGRTLARAATVEDYPYLARRGYIHGAAFPLFVLHDRQGGLKGPNPDMDRHVNDIRQFLLAFKFNAPVFGTDAAWGERAHPAWGYWRTPEQWDEGFKIPIVERLGAGLTPLGLSWYSTLRPHTGEPENKLCGDEETVRAVLWHARRAEAAGGHLCVLLDDARFPIHPRDVEQYGSAREADTWIFTNVLARLQQDYPKARLLVCPPFYWGPGGNVPASYGESRDDYLAAIGARWPADIDVFWTGSQVNGLPATKNQLDWIALMIRRKPFFWQNAVLTSSALYWRHTGGRPIEVFRNRAEFLDGVAFYGVNSAFPQSWIVNAIAADFMWNPLAHEPERAVREATSKTIGPEAWEIVKRMDEWLECLWPFYSLGRNEGVGPEEKKRAAVSLDWIEPFVTNGLAAVTELERRFPAAAATWGTTWRQLFETHKVRLIDEIRADNSLYYYRAAVEQKALARAAGEWEPEADIFYGACHFAGGILGEHEDVVTGRKQVVHGLGEGARRCMLAVSPGPADRVGTPHELLLNARLGNRAGGMTVAWNGRTVFEGDKPLDALGWMTLRLALPGEQVKAANTLAVSVADKPGAAERGGGWAAIGAGDAEDGELFRVTIRYAVLKQTKERAK